MKNILLLLFTLATSSFFSQNLLVNGGFETVSSSLPDNWVFDTGNFSIENNTVSEGSNSLKVIPATSDSGSLPTSLFSQTFTLSDTEEHTFTFNYYLEGSIIDNQISMLSFEFQNLNGSNAYFFTTGENFESGDFVYNQWTTITYTVKVLAFIDGATSTDIKLSLRAGSFDFSVPEGTEIFLDDFNLDAGTLGINDNTIIKQNSIVDYINNKSIYLKSNQKVLSYDIYTINGSQVISNSKLNSNSINLDFLNEGLYIAQFNLEQGNTYSQKIILE